MDWVTVVKREEAGMGASGMERIRVKLTIAYDGTAYAGWQMQKTGVGVQQLIEGALGRLFPNVGKVHSSSRTDTGVHAMGMVAHVDVPRGEFRMEVKKLALAINAHLPEDIRVMAVSRTRPGFHARFDAVGKQYRYFVWNHVSMNPLLRRQAWHVPVALDLAAMRAACLSFIGCHDFRSFAAAHRYAVESTIRMVTRCEVRKSGDLYVFVIEGDGFLYKMCRGIVGTLVQVGQGKIGAGELGKILESRDRRMAGMTAPAHGLVLWKVRYGTRERRASAGRCGLRGEASGIGGRKAEGGGEARETVRLPEG
jgi:tRNA pseudouridine38-40 synthase